MNKLIHETSPYLLQHAYNPVNWEPWTGEAFKRAEAENKLVIISIGYSACHWCHVMEHESFEDEQVAKLMNDNFICIKVDREERPDVDQLYMDAAQLMIGRGGWPLNAFALPDRKPVYAGTYFPKIAWMGLLKELSFGYKRQPAKYIEYAGKLISGISGLSIVPEIKKEEGYSKEILEDAFFSIVQRVDRTFGGLGRAPKFPMPHNWLFLLRYHHFSKDQESLQLTLLTLDKMAAGGIYDQIGGGFARYATDQEWKIPHLEKMLYDNVQLLSLYSEAYLITRKESYKEVVSETITFLSRELLSPEGALYSALDADSEGIEGKYYVWKEDEFDNLPGENAPLLKEYFGIGKEGLWEHGNNILVAAKSPGQLSDQFHIPEAEIHKIIREGKEKLLEYRDQRVKPGLDNKIILSWNALAIKGLLDAYKAFGDTAFKEMAGNILSFIRKNLSNDNLLFRSYQNGEPRIQGFLEDYAFYIDALLAWYQVTFEEDALMEAKKFIDKVIIEFGDEKSGMFWFTSSNDKELPARKIETSDNVIPTPNSVMAQNLHIAGILFDDIHYKKRSEKMLASMIPNIREQAAYYSNWAILLSNKTGPFYEVVFTGPDSVANCLEFEKSFIPNKVVAGLVNGSGNLPVLADKGIPGKSLIYICENFACLKPAETVQEALAYIQP
jgi:uncharacterized protein